MKRLKSILSVVLTFAIIASMALFCAPSANAATVFYDNDVVYSIISDFEAHVYGYQGTEPVVTIPEKIGARVITAVDSSAFKNNDVVEEVYLPKTVLSIGDMAFMYCPDLSYVGIPTSLNTIGDYAFAGCSSLNDIDINSNIKYISMGMFEQSGITSIKFPYNVTSIKASAFEGCTNLTSVTIPDRITSISEYAFLNCSGLERVNFGSGVTVIPANSFKNCSTLDEVVLSDNVTAINNSAFENCAGLNKIYIGRNCTDFGTDIFTGAENVSIYSYSGSPAEAFAIENNIPFTSLDNIDNSALGDVLDKANALLGDKNSPYTADSLANLQASADEAQAVYDSRFSLQDEIDAAAADVRNAVDALEIRLVECIIGDADLDGSVTVDDVTKIQSYMANYYAFTFPQLNASDVNLDGITDVNDVTDIQRYLARYEVENIGGKIYVPVIQPD